MESKELRKGNWTQYDGKCYQIAGINCDDTIRLICNDESHPNYAHGTIGCFWIGAIEPIPLTEEWLLRFGLKNAGRYKNKIALSGSPSGDMDGATLYEMRYDIAIYLKDDNFEYEIAQNSDDFGTNIFTKQVQYVHQLQNLHHALIGQELEIKK
jgi:hypothetical protein